MKASTTVYLISAITILALLGFFPTYFSKFPEFEGLENIHHFHGLMMMSWFGMLIAQPVLISYKKVDWHKLMGKVSYIVAPLVVISIFLVMRAEYYDDLAEFTPERSLAGLDLDFMSLFSFVVLYSLAIAYRKKMERHMRYMICTGLLIFIPGLARFFFFLLGLSGAVTGISIFVTTYGIYAALMIYDYKKAHTIRPYIVGLLLLTLTNIVVANNRSAAWQWFAGNIAEYTL